VFTLSHGNMFRLYIRPSSGREYTTETFFLRFVSPCIIVQFKQNTNQMQQLSSLLS